MVERLGGWVDSITLEGLDAEGLRFETEGGGNNFFEEFFFRRLLEGRGRCGLLMAGGEVGLLNCENTEKRSPRHAR